MLRSHLRTDMRNRYSMIACRILVRTAHSSLTFRMWKLPQRWSLFHRRRCIVLGHRHTGWQRTCTHRCSDVDTDDPSAYHIYKRNSCRFSAYLTLIRASHQARVGVDRSGCRSGGHSIRCRAVSERSRISYVVQTSARTSLCEEGNKVLAPCPITW